MHSFCGHEILLPTGNKAKDISVCSTLCAAPGKRFASWELNPAALGHEILLFFFFSSCTYSPAAKAMEAPAIKHMNGNEILAMIVVEIFFSERKKPLTVRVNYLIAHLHK